LKKRLFCLVLVLFMAVSFGWRIDVSSDDSADADAAMEARKFGLAKDLYRQVYINSADTGEQAKAMLGMAKADYGLKNYYEAGINLKRFFKNYPNSPLSNEGHLIWGLSYLYVKKFKEAGEQLNLVGGDLLQKAYVAKAELELLRGNIEEAEKNLAKLDTKFFETNSRALFLRAMILSKQGKHNEAISTIDRIPDPVLKTEDISVNKAIIYYNAGKYIDAKDMLVKIISEPSSRIESVQAKRTLFKIHDLENNENETLALAIELLDYESTDEMKMKVVSIYDRKKDIDNAFRYLMGMRDKKVLGAEIENRLKKLTADKNPRLDEYMSKYYIYLDPDSRYNIELSRYMAEKGRKDISRRILQKILKGRSGSEAAILLAEEFIAEKRYKEAKKLVQPVTTDVNFSGRACLLMARILENEGDYNGAESFRQRAIKILLAQKDYYRAGELYVKTGNKAEALKNYLKAADQGDVDAMIKTADLYYITGKTGLGKQYYKKAIDKGIKDPRNLQWADYQYGKLEEDDEYLDKAKAGGGVVADSAELMKSIR
jgi:tetratricopeptide (TPR) repeat protein